MSQIHYENVKTGKKFTCSKSQWDSMMNNNRIRGRIRKVDPPKATAGNAEAKTEGSKEKSTPTPPEAKEAKEDEDKKKSKTKSKSK